MPSDPSASGRSVRTVRGTGEIRMDRELGGVGRGRGEGRKEEGFSNFTKGEKERNEINGGGIIDSAQDIINKLVV